MDKEAKLSIYFENKSPIELVDLTESLLSLGSEYKRFVQRHSDLYVTPGYRKDTPVKVVFSPESLKVNMLYKDENPFKSAYIVDVMVETIENRPVLYKVVSFHEGLSK